MVQRVFGRANEFEVVFEHQEGDWWTITAPANLEGEYIVDIYAEDEAGNVSHICKALFAICGHELQIHVMDSGHRLEVREGGYNVGCRICGG